MFSIAYVCNGIFLPGSAGTQEYILLHALSLAVLVICTCHIEYLLLLTPNTCLVTDFGEFPTPLLRLFRLYSTSGNSVTKLLGIIKNFVSCLANTVKDLSMQTHKAIAKGDNIFFY